MPRSNTLRSHSPAPDRRSAGACLRLTLNAVLAAMALCLAGSATVAWAQEEERPVTDLTGVELSSEMLIEALRPQVEKPPGARSLARPSCAKYRQQLNRGLRPVPVSKNIAITVEFASDRSELTLQARKVLDELGAALEDPLLQECCFHVQGHTDSQNTESYNQRLSEARAQSVVDYITERYGLDPDRLLQEGFGETQPLASNETSEGRQRNRRVQVSNLGFQTAEGGP